MKRNVPILHVALVLLLLSGGAHAGMSFNQPPSDAAQGDGEDKTDQGKAQGDGKQSSDSTSPVTDGKLDEADISRLYSGAIPKVSHLDDFYKYSTAKGTRNGKTVSLEHLTSCRSDWKRLRAEKVTKKPVKVSLTNFMEHAKRVGLAADKLKRLLATFLANQDAFPNQDYITIADFDKKATEERMFIINLRTGFIERHKVAHGSGSGPMGGVPTHFSNDVNGTHKSSLGCGVATYSTKPNGKPLKDFHSPPRHIMLLQGFEPGNDQMCNRTVFFHPAAYVAYGGRSWGCPALMPGEIEDQYDKSGKLKKKGIYSKLSGGSLYCAFHDGK